MESSKFLFQGFFVPTPESGTCVRSVMDLKNEKMEQSENNFSLGDDNHLTITNTYSLGNEGKVDGGGDADLEEGQENQEVEMDVQKLDNDLERNRETMQLDNTLGVIDLQEPTKGDSEISHEPEIPVLHRSIPLLQHCIFCPASFKCNESYIAHIGICNPTLKLLINWQIRKCLCCCKKFGSYNITGYKNLQKKMKLIRSHSFPKPPCLDIIGLLRHSINCIIKDRTGRIRSQPELKQCSVKIQRMSPIASSGESPTTTAELPTTRSKRLLKPVSYRTYRSQNLEKKQISSPNNARSAIGKTPQQISTLKSFLKRHRYPSNAEYEELANETGLSTNSVKFWFQRNRFNSFNSGIRRIQRSHVTKKASGTSQLPTGLPIKKRHGKSEKPGKNKRQFPEEVTRVMLEFFRTNEYPTANDRRELRKRTNLNDQQIKDFFQNLRRNPERAKKKLAVLRTETKRRDSPIVKPCVKSINTAASDGIRESRQSKNKDDKQQTTVAALPEEKKQILLDAFRVNPNPMAIDIIEISQRIHASTFYITDWFARQRRKRGFYSDHRASVSSVTSASTEQNSDDSKIVQQETKCMTLRQRLKAIKHAPVEKISEILAKCNETIQVIMSTYAFADASTQSILETECIGLTESFETNHLFTASQETTFNTWEDDVAHSMFPIMCSSISNWIELVEKFREKILHIWSRVIVYSNYFEMSLNDAAVEIVQLSFTLNQKDVTLPESWSMVNLFEQISRGADGLRNDDEESDPDSDCL